MKAVISKLKEKKILIPAIAGLVIVLAGIMCLIIFGAKKYTNEKGSIVIGNYSNIEYEKTDSNVTEEEIQANLDVLANRYAEINESDKEIVEKGDTVNIAYKASKDNKLIESFASDDYTLKIGTGTLIKGIDAGIIGMKVGETKNIESELGSDFGEYAGKVTIEIKLNKIYEVIVPEINDEFAQMLNFEDLEALREYIIVELSKEKEEIALEENSNNVIESAMKKFKVTANKKEVDKTYKDMIGIHEENAKALNQTLEEYATLSMGYKTKKEFEDDIRVQAENETKMNILVEEVAKKENITVSDSEYKNYLNEESANMKIDAEEYEKAIGKEILMRQILREKVIEFILDNAKAK